MKKTHIYFVLDRSGSMNSIKEGVIAGFNNFVKEQQATPGDLRMSFYQFDSGWDAASSLETVFENRKIKSDDVIELTEETFVPRGGTPLLDAMGRVINIAAENVTARKTAGKKDELIIFVTMTDGAENASHEFTRESLKRLVDEKTSSGWAFIYLGANQDAFAEAGSYGTSAGNTVNYVGTRAGAQSVINVASRNISSYRAASYAGQSIDNTAVMTEA